MKKILLAGLLLNGFAAQAQVKHGSKPAAKPQLQGGTWVLVSQSMLIDRVFTTRTLPMKVTAGKYRISYGADNRFTAVHDGVTERGAYIYTGKTIIYPATSNTSADTATVTLLTTTQLRLVHQPPSNSTRVITTFKRRP
jgi:hypothetical protein